MFKRGSKRLIFILYDGVRNSVFVSQVLQPLLNQLEKDRELEITLISFEKWRPSNEFLIKTIPAHDRLHLVLARRVSFFGKLSLFFSVLQFKRFLRISVFDQVVARGPLAGWVAIKSLKSLQKSKELVLEKQDLKNFFVKIQARGLCAQEYRFAYKDAKENFLRRILRKLIFRKLHNIESESYGYQHEYDLNRPLNVKIEAVSPALKDYLIENFKVTPAVVAIAKEDLPAKIRYEEKELWRWQVREELGIPQDSHVYCYSGSVKPWQCVPEAIQFFSEQYKKDPRSFLLILSTDVPEVEKIINKFQIPVNRYLALSVEPKNLDRYLCACDSGLLFRDKDIINWVSRPTKMLEYQAAGLQVIHNHTIDWLERQQ